MDKLVEFEQVQAAIRTLDFQGHSVRTLPMYRQFQRRNSFGLDFDRPIYRIFQRDFLESDIAEGCLTLPRASASAWSDPLENPLADIYDVDVATGRDLHLGSLVSSFHALCWTHRKEPRSSDWLSFSHGKDSVRISTTVGKLMDRVMRIEDAAYMHRAWLIEVAYKDVSVIQAMRNPAEVYRRMESQGALLAFSAAVVRSAYTDEDEVRLLFDPSILPEEPTNVVDGDAGLLRIPFDWNGFIDHSEHGPRSLSA